jgi:hypothetical protein
MRVQDLGTDSTEVFWDHVFERSHREPIDPSDRGPTADAAPRAQKYANMAGEDANEAAESAARAKVAALRDPNQQDEADLAQKYADWTQADYEAAVEAANRVAGAADMYEAADDFDAAYANMKLARNNSAVANDYAGEAEMGALMGQWTETPSSGIDPEAGWSDLGF